MFVNSWMCIEERERERMPHKSQFVHALKATSHINDALAVAVQARTNYKAF